MSWDSIFTFTSIMGCRRDVRWQWCMKAAPFYFVTAVDASRPGNAHGRPSRQDAEKGRGTGRKSEGGKFANSIA